MTTTILPRNKTKVPIEFIAATLKAFAICNNLRRLKTRFLINISYQ